MIVVRIYGGLGNQIFQYSFGKALSLNSGRELILDHSPMIGKRGEKYRKTYKGFYYRLNKYNIDEKYLNPSQSNFINIIRKKKLYKLINNIAVLSDKKKLIPYYIKEEYYDPSVINKHSFIYFDGYWQDFNYFSDYIKEIRKNLTLKNELDCYNNELLKEIKSVNSVSIHFIRGIKVADNKHRKIFHQSSMNYFFKAYDYIREKVENPKFFIFSNGIDWIKKNWPKEKPVTFIDNAGPDYEHHFLMSRCNHNIVDNSTFSYTAAYLNANPQKIVIAPKIWTKKKRFNNSNSWIIMDNS